jgi:GMP reductase
VGSGLRLQSVSVCTGTNKIWDPEAEDYARMKQVLDSFPDVKMITVDVANAYHQNFVDFIKMVRDEFPDKVIVAGNVVTPEMVEELIINGADMVKIGIGPGSVCTTRTMTGIGVPQFSAIVECADAANGVDGHIMADGGCVWPGDIAKALGGGAHAIQRSCQQHSGRHTGRCEIGGYLYRCQKTEGHAQVRYVRESQQQHQQGL